MSVVNGFFDRLARPVDAGTEVGEIRGRAETYAVIGWSAVLLGALPVLIALTQGLDGGWPIYFALSVVLCGGGAIFLALKRRG